MLLRNIVITANMKKDIKTYLKQNAGVEDSHLLKMEERFLHRSVQKGELLRSKNELCKQFFYVEEGLLRFYTIDNVGKEHIIQFAVEGWFIGNRSSIYFDIPSDFFIDTLENSKVVMLDEAHISYMCEVSPQFRKYNERLLQNHIRFLQRRINLLISASATDRYLDFLRLYPDLAARVPQWMVASFLGITPESLSRVRKELVKK